MRQEKSLLGFLVDEPVKNSALNTQTALDTVMVLKLRDPRDLEYPRALNSTHSDPHHAFSSERNYPYKPSTTYINDFIAMI